MTYGNGSQPAELSIINTRVIDFTSSVNGRDFRLQIGLPLFPAPSRGYRPFYVLDGNAYSATAIEAVRFNLNAPDVIVVGIGYPETEKFIAASAARHGPPNNELEASIPPFLLAFMRERLFDLMLPTSAEELATYHFPGAPRDPSLTGGLDGLLETIERDIRPQIAQFGPIDETGGALFGHSAGGHAVVHALFRRPHMVRTFIAASSAIWVSGRSVLAGEAGFAAMVARGDAAPRVLVTMGSEESSIPRGMLPELRTPELIELIRKARMVEDSRELVDRLKAIKGGPGYEVADYAVFPEQQHGIAVWPAIGRAIDFAFQR